MSSAACSIRPSNLPNPKAVRVNGVMISRGAISREMQNHPAPKAPDSWKAAAMALVLRELLLQEADRLAKPAQPIEDDQGRRETMDEARIRCLIESEVKVPEPQDDECRRYYDNNRDRFRTPDIHHVSHILLAAGASAEQRRSAREQACAVLLALQESPESFSQLARLHSACSSREVGGSLGQIGPGQTVEEFEQALKSMSEGAIHPELVETRYGFHVVRMDRRIKGQVAPFDLVRARIGAYLAERVHRKALRQYLMLLAGRASIEGVELDVARTPLVQ